MHTEARAGRIARRAGVRAMALVLVAGLVLGACQDDSSPASEGAILHDGEANPGPLPTLAGGVELPVTRYDSVLVGEGLAYGTPLPSEVRAAAAYKTSPEIADVLVRRVHDAASGEMLGESVLLRIDGAEVFDEGVLGEFVVGLVAAGAGAEAEDRPVGAVVTHRATGATRAVAGYRIGDLISLVLAGSPARADAIVDRQLAARAAGQVGSEAPVTPMLPGVPVDGAFVPVPSVSFVPFPPPEDEDPPVPPGLAGATSVQGRYGVVAGERRTTVWSYALDPGTYPTAEALAPALASLVSSIAGGRESAVTEVVDRVVVGADRDPDLPPRDPTDDTVEPLVARAFRHGSIAIVVTGRDAGQVDAAVSDWISRLAAP